MEYGRVVVLSIKVDWTPLPRKNKKYGVAGVMENFHVWGMKDGLMRLPQLQLYTYILNGRRIRSRLPTFLAIWPVIEWTMMML